MNVLFIGNGAKSICETLSSSTGTTVICSSVDWSSWGRHRCETDIMNAAFMVAKMELQNKVDIVVLCWDFQHSSSSANLLPFMEIFKTYQDRVYLCVRNGTYAEVARLAEKDWVLQSILLFFNDRLFHDDHPAMSLKKLFKKRPFVGEKIRMDILATEDYVQGAKSRCHAKRELFSDEYAQGVMKKRFESQLRHTLTKIY